MTVTKSDESTGAEHDAPAPTPKRALGWLYLLGGLVGLVSSAALIIEKIEKLTHPSYVPSCSLNPIVSCGSVMDSAQAALFGFPNPLIGVAAFPVVVTSGVALLAGFTAPRWFWTGMQVGTTLGVVFVHWLIYQSLYEIGALCPYCMVVWVVTIATFWYTTLRNLNDRAPVLARFHSVFLIVWYLVIVVMMLQAFWDYWVTVI